MSLSQKILMCAESGEYLNEAKMLSEKSGFKFLQQPTDAENGNLILLVGKDGLTLSDNRLSLRGDFSSLVPRLKVNNLNGEMIVKAARIKGVNPSQLTVLDATAGLGEDSFLLAAAGFTVNLYEYDPVIAALLRDALARALDNPTLSKITQRMTLHEEDSIAALPRLTKVPDIILLDPMFPERQKSGLIKKKFQLLQQLETPCVNEIQLLSAALEIRPMKIIVKRPINSKFFADYTPSYSIKGKSIRYDCIVIR